MTETERVARRIYADAGEALPIGPIIDAIRNLFAALLKCFGPLVNPDEIQETLANPTWGQHRRMQTAKRREWRKHRDEDDDEGWFAFSRAIDKAAASASRTSIRKLLAEARS